MAGNHTSLGRLRNRISKKNTHYRSTGFYKHVGLTATKIIAFYVIFILIIYLISIFVIDFKKVFNYVIENLSDRNVLIVFTISESILGLLPPDIFVVWTAKFESPMPMLFLLGVLSFLGGVISYLLGSWISKRPKVEAYLEQRLQVYISFTRRWGGAFIVIAALFPFSPFAIVCIAISVLRYPFKPFFLYALSRTLRFVLQGLLFFDMFDLDAWLV